MSSGNHISLFNMPAGKTGRIIEIDGGLGMVNRLETIGIRIGSKVQKVAGQWMNGPVMLKIGNMRLAVGCGMARRIWLEME